MKTVEEILFSKLNKSVLTPVARNIVFDAMKEYADQFNPSWIKCEERLPENSGHILLFLPKTDEYEETICIYYFVKGMKKIAGEGSCWMPLPKKP